MVALNGLKACAVAVALFALAFGSGFPLLFRLAYAVIAMVVLGLIWAWVNVIGLDVRRETSGQRAHVGQFVEERLTLRNRLLLPKAWIEVRDHSTLPGHRASQALSLGPKGEKHWSVRTRCQRRGRYILGPLSILGGDPFGLFRARRGWGGVATLIVYPATVELPHFELPMGQLPGGPALRERSPHITPSSLGIRAYTPGDGLNRIHWPSTARLGSLTVKEFELDPTSDMWLVLDAHYSVQAGSGDQTTLEYGVTIVASLAKLLLAQHRAVGLIVYSSRPCVLPPDRGDRQYMRIMEELAILQARGRWPLAEVLVAERGRFGRHTTLIVATPSLQKEWVAALQHTTRQGIRAAAVLLEPDTFGGHASSQDIVSDLVAAHVPTFVVKQGDDLARDLSGSGSLSI